MIQPQKIMKKPDEEIFNDTVIMKTLEKRSSVSVRLGKNFPMGSLRQGEGDGVMFVMHQTSTTFF